MDTRDWAVSVPAGYRFGRWSVTVPLGAGGWGGVYEVVPDLAARPALRPAGWPDGWPDRAAAKFLPVRILNARRLRYLAEMADREAAAHATLCHPRLIRRFETVIVADEESPQLDGAVAVVMERAERSLADGPALRGRDVAARVVLEICEGLAHMHGAGWVHGDLKPGNVLIMADGSVRLADFGLATEIEGTHGYLPPAASPEYCAPERATAELTERGAAVRQSVDIWALGVTAHQVLAGRSPFPGPSGRARAAAAADFAAGRTQLSLSPDIDACWRDFVADCLAPEPLARPSSAELLERARELAAGARLGRAAAWRGTAAARLPAAPAARPEVPAPARVPRPGRRSTRAAVAGAGAAGLVAALAVGATALRGGPDGAPRVQPVTAEMLSASSFADCPPGALCAYTGPAGEGAPGPVSGDNLDLGQYERFRDAESLFNRGARCDVRIFAGPGRTGPSFVLPRGHVVLDLAGTPFRHSVAANDFCA